TTRPARSQIRTEPSNRLAEARKEPSGEKASAETVTGPGVAASRARWPPVATSQTMTARSPYAPEARAPLSGEKARLIAGDGWPCKRARSRLAAMSQRVI